MTVKHSKNESESVLVAKYTYIYKEIDFLVGVNSLYIRQIDI